MNPRRIFVDMDGTLAEWKNVESENVLYEKGYYENLKPNENLLNAIKDLIAKGENVFILSSFLHDSKFALLEKNAWLDNYLPELPKDRRIFTDYGDKKSIYIVGGITNNDYLIDDYTKNLLEWKESGGIGIKYLNGINHSKGTWKGLKLKDSDYISNDLDELLNHPEKTLDNFNITLRELKEEFKKAIQLYSSSIDKSIEEMLNAELQLKDAKIRFLDERAKLLEQYDIEIINTWTEDENLAIHYKIGFKDGKTLYEGYDYIEEPKSYSNDTLINEILCFDVKDRISINVITPEIKYFVDGVLGNDIDGTIRLYSDDLSDYWGIEEQELPEKIDAIKEQLERFGLEKFVNISILDTYPKTLNYIDIEPTIISQFDFANKDYQRKTVSYDINGKNVVCEIEYDDNLKGYSVMGYTVDNKFNSPDKVQQILTPEELAKIKGFLLNEVNEMFNKKYNKDLEDIDIAEDYC